jgi:CBS domain-containing protein
MTASVRTVTPETTACEIAQLFANHGIGSAVVVDPETAAVLGIVTESDVMKQVAAGADIGTVEVGTFLSETVISVPSDTEIHEAARVMREHSIQRLLVMDDGQLSGMLTTSDLTDYIPRLRNTIRRNRSQAVRQRL